MMVMPTSSATSAATNNQSYLRCCRNEPPRSIGFGLQAGVDFHCLRSFLPKTNESVCFSLGDMPVSLAGSNSNSGNFSLLVSCSLPNMSIQDQNSICSGETRTEDFSESVPGASQSIVNNNITDNFLTESELQCQILFTFIKRGIDWIHYQLDERSDCVKIPIDHYADISSYMNAGAERKPEMSQDDLEDSKYFCDDALTLVRQLKDCLMINLTQLYSILDAYGRAFPEDSHSVTNFEASKRQSINNLTGQLEQCQNAVQDHKKYLEARLTVVGWDELMKPQHRCFVLYSLAHFILFMLGMVALAWYAGYKDRYIGLFYLYRGPMFITLYFYFYSLNLVGWATAKIRYVDIFSFSSARETPDPYVIFNIAGILGLMFTGFVAMLIFTVHFENTETRNFKLETKNSEIPERILPLLLWIIVAFVLLNPFKWLIRKGRYGVVKVTMRILLAPFYRVRFGDYWFACQLNSIIVILLDLEFMLCFYSYVWPLDKNEDGKVCNNDTYIVRPVISCLPGFWRLMQCLRCYYDTRHYPHLINAGKYLTTFPVVILFELYTEDHKTFPEELKTFPKELLDELKNNHYLAAWAVSSFIHAICTFIWDIYMDWGLLRCRNLLRPKLGYSWKLFYYLAIVEDLILRFAWSLKLSLGLHLRAQVNLFYTLLAGLEIFRWFVWNFYRVEYEHIKISGTQLPYNYLPCDEDSDDDEFHIKGNSLLQQHSCTQNEYTQNPCLLQ